MSVPLIDLQSGDDVALARRVDAALREAGFFALVGHGVPQSVFDAAFGASKRFFALGRRHQEALAYRRLAGQARFRSDRLAVAGRGHAA